MAQNVTVHVNKSDLALLSIASRRKIRHILGQPLSKIKGPLTPIFEIKKIELVASKVKVSKIILTSI